MLLVLQQSNLMLPSIYVRHMFIHFCSSYICGGYVLPSTCLADLLHPAAMAVDRQCYCQGVIGYISMDFIIYLNKEERIQTLMAVDL